MPSLPPLSPRQEIHKRLQLIFPEGSPNRAHSVWEIAARTVFVMLYVGAVEGLGTWLRPDQVTRMTDDQAGRTDDASRNAWAKESLKSSKGEISGRWYAANTRESIRDDTIRNALIPNGAVIELEGLPTTSPAPRYALSADFASLFDPSLTGRLSEAIAAWRSENLSAGALARIAIRRQGAASGGEHVIIQFPSGDSRRVAPGPSSLIAKAVVEEFARRFLGEPGVVLLSESRNKVVSRDDELARSIGLSIEADRNLPDIILVDLAPRYPKLVFVEVVATDGPVSEERKSALTKLAEDAGFPAKHLVFVTAYLDRSESVFRKTVDSLAWGTFAWFVSEPQNLLQLSRGTGEASKRFRSGLQEEDESDSLGGGGESKSLETATPNQAINCSISTIGRVSGAVSARTGFVIKSESLYVLRVGGEVVRQPVLDDSDDPVLHHHVVERASAGRVLAAVSGPVSG